MLVKYTINGTYTVGSNINVTTDSYYTNLSHSNPNGYSLVISLDTLEEKNYQLGVNAFLTGMFDDVSYVTLRNNSTGFVNVVLENGVYKGEFEAVLFGNHGRFVLKKGVFEIDI